MAILVERTAPAPFERRRGVGRQRIRTSPVHEPCQVHVLPTSLFRSIFHAPTNPASDPRCGPGGLGGIGPLNEPANIHFLLSWGIVVHRPVPPTQMPLAIVGVAGGGYDPTKVPLHIQRPLPRFLQPMPTSAMNMAGADDVAGANVWTSLLRGRGRWNDARRLSNRSVSSDTMYAGISRQFAFPGK
jgi:hypothetical protein